jgi:eukaryotic-like serine/threonine-protein kinase
MDETTRLTGGANRRVLVGRYALRGLIGRGGMADVELADDEVLDREVAVKILHQRYAQDPTFLARFRREAQAAASLNHPNVVAVYDTGADDGRPFIVMEYVRGRSLRDILAHEGVLPQRAAEIAGEAADALHYAHERGLVHRDIKPGNIMVSHDGRVKVTDFGIARAINAETVTQTAAVFGTAAYVSPEQARGDQVDRHTDVYSLGCVLYEMLTGRQPFAADSPVALAYKHISEDPVPPSRINPEVSRAFDAVVLRAMAKDPEQRYQTEREFAEDLQRAARGQPVSGLAAAATTQVINRAAPPAPSRRREEHREGRREEMVYAEEAPQRRTALPWILGVLVVLALVGLVGLVASQFTSTRLDTVAVPEVRGRSVLDAQSALVAAGFQPRLAQPVQSADVPEGSVVSTDPNPGTMAPQGSVVTITPSAGPAPVSVPPVAGLPEEEARQALTAADLQVGERTAATSDAVPVGTVISSSPSEGTEVPPGTAVDLVVSDGPSMLTLPDVTGLSEAEAGRQLENACDRSPCVQVQVERRFDDRVDEGRVLRQTPEEGDSVPIGSTVTLLVSAGPEPEPSPEPSPSLSPTPEPTPTATG